MNKNKKLNEYGFAHLSLVVIVLLSAAVIGLAAYRVNEARTAKSSKTTDVQTDKTTELVNESDKQTELAEETLPIEQSSKPSKQEVEEEKPPQNDPDPLTVAPRQVYFVKGGQSVSDDAVELTHVMTEALSGTCTFTFSLNGTVRVEKTVEINSSKACSVSIPKSEFPKSAEYSETTRFLSSDNSVFAETQPYGILVM